MKEITEQSISKLEEAYKKELTEYMKYDYPISVSKIEGEYEAVIEDLPGCVGYGSTKTEALDNLNEYKKIWFLYSFKNGVHPRHRKAY